MKIRRMLTSPATPTADDSQDANQPGDTDNQPGDTDNQPGGTDIYLKRATIGIQN